MIKLISTLRMHLLFIVLLNVMYIMVDIFRPQQLDSDWFFLYMAVCIFIYLAAGWVVMHEIGKRRLAVLAGLIVFLAGYIIQIMGLFVVLPLIKNYSWSSTLTALLKFIHYGVYYALIALMLALIGTHLCSQYQRHKKSPSKKQH
ncbi:MAG: hypothetical protein K2Q14_03070 [Gammaproteobacteria bacterium]|nr:hypothetical protein [Gammaproteobacteria bacterium]